MTLSPRHAFHDVVANYDKGSVAPLQLSKYRVGSAFFCQANSKIKTALMINILC